MKHFASPSFWECFEKLPITVQNLAKKNFTLLKNNSEHPSLHLKKVNKYWSVRVGRRYRCLAIEIEKGMLWFWIGTHTEYDSMLKNI